MSKVRYFFRMSKVQKVINRNVRWSNGQIFKMSDSQRGQKGWNVERSGFLFLNVKILIPWLYISRFGRTPWPCWPGWSWTTWSRWRDRSATWPSVLSTISTRYPPSPRFSLPSWLRKVKIKYLHFSTISFFFEL